MTQPSKMSFSDPVVAQRTRDVIQKVAEKKVTELGSNPNVGRVMSVDLAKLTASVWFATDDAPVQVNMFPGSVPLDLGDFRTSSAYDTAAIGTGGLVYVENFRGKPYITRVLSGGEYTLNQNVLGLTHRMFNATPQGTLTGPPVANDIYERTVSVLIPANQSFVSGNCLLVGPWSGKNDGSSVDGIMELTLNYWVTGSGVNQSRKYVFSVSDRMIVDLPGGAVKPFWMRLLPEKNLGTSPHAELAVDVALVRTNIRTSLEFWFRLVPLDTWADQTVYFMSVRTFGSAFNVGDPKTGRIVTIKNTTTDPVQGFLGFNNAGMGWTERDEYATFTRGTWFQGDEWSSGSWRSAALRAASDLRWTWRADGQWTWDASALFWENNIVFTGIGPNWNALHTAVLKVPMPTGSIPVFPATPGAGVGNQIRNLDGSGRIPLNAGDTLYYAIAPGIGTGGQGNWYSPHDLFFIVDNKNFTADIFNFGLPEWCIPIASRAYVTTGNNDRRDIYIHNPSVNADIDDRTTWTSVSYTSSHTGIIGGDETETMFVPSFVYRAKTAYRVWFKCGAWPSAAGQAVEFRLKKGTTAAGADLGEYYRAPTPLATAHQAEGELIVFNDTTSDITTAITLTGQMTGPNTNTWQRFASTATPAYVLVERIGNSGKYAALGRQI